MKRSFYDRRGLLILMLVFFLVPFALRGARLAVEGMRNDVKDWLPDRFAETGELNWFREHFLGEQFMVVSWEGCHGTLDDQRFKLFVDKFFPETPPSQREANQERNGSNASAPASSDDTQSLADSHGVSPLDSSARLPEYVDEENDLYARQLQSTDPEANRDFVGNRLQLFVTGNYHENWGGEEEKWLKGINDDWYYVKPNGDIFRWNGHATVLGVLGRSLHRWQYGKNQLDGELVAVTGNVDGPWYYRDPRRLEADLFKSVTTGPGVLHNLIRPDGSLDGNYVEAMRRLRGSLFGPDGKQTCMIVTLSDLGRQRLHRVIGRGVLGKPRGKLLNMAAEAGIAPPEVPSFLPAALAENSSTAQTASAMPVVRLGGPAVDNVAIDEEGQITLVRLVGLSALVGIGLSWLSFRSVYVTMMVLFVGAVSAIASVSFVWWGGSSVDAVLMTMPSLVYVLGLSGAIHIVNYYREAVESNGLAGGPEAAVGHGWKPCTLAAITTALGLLSLSSSDIVPIEKFGFYSAIGVVATLILLFTYLPSALQLWPPGYHRTATTSAPTSELHQRIQGAWAVFGEFIIRRHGLVTAACLLVMVACAAGLPRLNTSIQLLKLFDGDAKIIRDYEWLEGHLGKLVPMELVVRVSPELIKAESDLSEAGRDSVAADRAPALTDDSAGVDPEELASATPPLDDALRLNFLERMEIGRYLQDVIEEHYGEAHGDIVGQAMLASTFSPELPDVGGSITTNALRTAASRRLRNYREEFLASDYLRVDKDDQSELWRVSLRLGALNNVDYGQFVGSVKQVVEPVLRAYGTRLETLQHLTDANKNGRYRGSKVLLLGAPLGRSSFASVPRQGSDDSSAAPTPGAEPAAGAEDALTKPIDQGFIFARTLSYLFRNASVRVTWHDPRFELPADWQQTLEAYDCVLVLDGDSRYDFAALSEQLPHVVDARNHAYAHGTADLTANQRKEQVAVVYTGLVPIVYKAQRTLLDSLTQSTFWAFAMISVVMVLLLRSLRAGLLAMVPNVFPVAIVFGLMGWRNILVDIGTMMTASVAMGVAVDDTIHFLTWFRRGIDDGMDRYNAIRQAYQRCATAMTQTTLIGGLGLSVFALSTFTPTQRFGTMMLTLMATALVGDLIMLPALLASPLGNLFSTKKQPSGKTTGHEDEPVGTEPSRQDRSQSTHPHTKGGSLGDDTPTQANPLPSDRATPYLPLDPAKHCEGIRFDRGHGNST
ncbi:MAG: MMPL family transporter [Pirellulaceae bacterium]